MHQFEAETARHIVVIMLREALIARDIELIVQDLRPNAPAVVARNVEEVTARLFRGDVIDIAFVDELLSAIGPSDFAQRIATDRGTVVLVGHEPGAVPQRPNLTLLQFPFTREDVEKLVFCQPVC